MKTSIVPWLSVRQSARALEFYQAAFGAAVLYRLDDGKGGVVARLAVDGAEFWMGEESPQYGDFSPESIGGSAVRMILSVNDPDEVFARAVGAGGIEMCPVKEDHGWRVGKLKDPFGHVWEIARPPDRG